MNSLLNFNVQKNSVSFPFPGNYNPPPPQEKSRRKNEIPLLAKSLSCSLSVKILQQKAPLTRIRTNEKFDRPYGG